MNADDTVRNLMWYFPTLASNRTEALQHILHGGGYCWQDGELCDTLDYERCEAQRPHHADREQALAAAIERERERTGRADISEHALDLIRKLAYEQADHVRHVRENIDTLARELPALAKFSSFSDHSNLARIPDDATDSWLDACEQFARHLARSTQSTYLRDCDVAPLPEPTVERLHAHNREMGVVDDILDRPHTPLTMSQFRERYDEQLADRQSWLRADKRAVAANRKLAVQALSRVQTLRAGRRPVCC